MQLTVRTGDHRVRGGAARAALPRAAAPEPLRLLDVPGQLVELVWTRKKRIGGREYVCFVVYGPVLRPHSGCGVGARACDLSVKEKQRIKAKQSDLHSPSLYLICLLASLIRIHGLLSYSPTYASSPSPRQVAPSSGSSSASSSSCTSSCCWPPATAGAAAVPGGRHLCQKSLLVVYSIPVRSFAHTN